MTTTPHLEPQTDGSEPTAADRRRAAQLLQAYVSAQLGLSDGVEALNAVLDEANVVDRVTPLLVAVCDVAIDVAPEFLSGVTIARLRAIARDARATEAHEQRERAGGAA